VLAALGPNACPVPTAASRTSLTLAGSEHEARPRARVSFGRRRSKARAGPGAAHGTRVAGDLFLGQRVTDSDLAR